MRLSVIIPTFNGRHYLENCIPSVQDAVRHAGVETELIVVDDFSSDGTDVWLAEAHPDVKIIAQKKNGGFARAVNEGFRAAKGEWIALLNNDVVVDREWVSAALGDEHPPEVGALAARILYADRRSIINSAGDEYALSGIARQWLTGKHISEDTHRERCFAPCAAAAFYRRSAIEKTGFFRESFGAYYEDVDLGFRLNLAGYHCLYMPGATCWHVSAGSYGVRSWRRLFNSARNKELVFWGNMPLKLLAKYAPAHFGIIFLQLLWSMGAGGFFPRMLGTMAALSRIPEIIAIRRDVARFRTVATGALERRMLRRWFVGFAKERIRRLWTQTNSGNQVKT